MTPTSDERREVAAKLMELAEGNAAVECSKVAHALGLEYEVHGCIAAFGRADVTALADFIDPTCVYEPTETLTRWDENDNEHETNEPDFDCGTFACSRCGYEMLYGDEGGWFDTEPPYAPHFKFCPNCRARVLPLKLYDKVVTDDDE